MFVYKAKMVCGEVVITNYFAGMEMVLDAFLEYNAVLAGGSLTETDRGNTRTELKEYLEDIENRDKDKVWTVRLSGEEEDEYIDISKIAVYTDNSDIPTSGQIIDAVERELENRWE